jgi:carboxylesterase
VEGAPAGETARSLVLEELEAVYSIFQKPEHQPFLWPGGRPAALLVHGFPGTPAEMRPLGELLRQAGWTVQGLLLPGFGPQIDTLDRRRYEEWRAAVQDALQTLRRDHAPILLVGYSMGGALSIVAAATSPPDGLILLAPFWRSGSSLQRAVGAILRPFLPHYVRPFQRIDLADPQVRWAIASYVPQIDLDDPDVQREIRQISMPVSLLDQVGRAGRAAYRVAALVEAPLLVVQGKGDRVVNPEYTLRLVRRFRRPLRYLAVNAGHDLINPGGQDWPAVEQAILEFADSVLHSGQRKEPGQDL